MSPQDMDADRGHAKRTLLLARLMCHAMHQLTCMARLLYMCH